MVRLGVERGRLSELALTEPIVDVLGKWKLTTGERPLNAATALFTKDTGMYTQFTMRLARFQGTDKNEFIDNQRVEGNIFVLLNEAMNFFRKHLNVLIYRSSTGKVNVNVLFSQDTFWLSQKRMSELFNVTIQDISYHLIQINDSGELQLSTAIKKLLNMSDNCEDAGTILYNLDAIIAVGYRVNSYEATQFRIWARNVLKEYIIKGFVLDDERLKGQNPFGADYFEELLERIREIRTSERRYYQKITDIYAECSSDYDKDSEITRTFYKTVQNMMHYAVTHQTAAEIVYDRADAEKPHMGLMTWKNAPDGRVIKSDVTIAKNYLSEQEVDELNLLTTAFLDIAERRARRHVLTTMAEWKQVLEHYLQVSDADILPGAGTISHELAESKAIEEYEKFRRIQDQTLLSDFDKFIEDLK